MSWISNNLARLALRFEPPLEREFMRENAERGQTLIRYAFLAGGAIFVAFWLVDIWTYQRLADPLTAVALTVAAGATTGAGVLAWITRHPLRLQRITTWLLAVVGLSLSVISARCMGLDGPEPYGMMPMHILYVYFLAGLLTRDAVRVTIASSIAYLLAQLVLNEVSLLIGERMIALGVLIGIAALGCRMQEAARRQNWLLARRLEDEARRDELTGLANRRALFEQAQTLFASAAREHRPVSVILLDLDYFKLLNDSCGHAAGDDALCRIGAEVQRAARRATDTAARYGGEEFLLLLYDCPAESAGERAEALRKAIHDLDIGHPRSPFHRVTVSIGVVGGIPMPKDNLEAWTAEADALLYQAKSNGRDKVITSERAPEINLPDRFRRYA